MSAQFRWEGLDDFKRELRAMPRVATDGARERASSGASKAADEIRANYPSRTGRLKNGVRVIVRETGPLAVHVDVVNTAPLAWIFEHGSDLRHSAIGADRGRMPAGNVFEPRAIRWRQWFDEQLVTLLTSLGLTVTP